MLLEPPCIPAFIGCHDWPFDPAASGDDGSVYIPPYTTSSSSGTFGGSDSGSGNNIVIGPRSGTNSSRSNGNGFTPGSPGLTDKDQYALYTVTLKNLGAKPLSGLKLTHGPVPFGSTFNPLHSSTSCQFFSQNVQCNQNLNPSQTTRFPIVYKVTNAAHCRVTPVLQSIRAAFADPTAGTPPVSANVQCTTVKGNELLSALGPMKETKDRYVLYTVTAKNKTASPAKGAVLSHGTVPAGFSFNAAKSSSACSESGSFVLCTQDLGGSQTKKFPIVYTVKDGSKCDSVPSLRSIVSPASVAASVQCAESDSDNIDQEIAKQTTEGNGKGFLAVYDVTLKNLSTTVNAARATHGPVPDDALFDATRSDGSCRIGNSIVACDRTINGSETQTFKITYKVSDPLYCEHTPVLKTIAISATSEKAPIPPISASVGCSIESVGTQTNADTGNIDAIPEPQTGANDLYYQSTKGDDYVLLPHPTAAIDHTAVPVFWLSCTSILLLGFAMWMKFPTGTRVR